MTVSIEGVSQIVIPTGPRKTGREPGSGFRILLRSSGMTFL